MCQLMDIISYCRISCWLAAFGFEPQSSLLHHCDSVDATVWQWSPHEVSFYLNALNSTFINSVASFVRSSSKFTLVSRLYQQVLANYSYFFFSGQLLHLCKRSDCSNGLLLSITTRGFCCNRIIALICRAFCSKNETFFFSTHWSALI